MAHLVCHAPRSNLPNLTPSEEEYLEAIYRLEEKFGERVKVRDLAKHLGIRDPSAVEMLQKLKEKGLVSYDRSGVKLAERGKRQAVRIVRRHELAERLLSDVFKHSLPGVHEHACEFEHVLDDELTDKIDRMLGNPATCPHGGPIPTPDGKIAGPKGKALSDLGEDENCVVMVIPEERGSVERLLSLNILPGARLRVVEKMPRGAIVLQCGKTQVALSRDIASNIRVRGLWRHRHRGGRQF